MIRTLQSSHLALALTLALPACVLSTDPGGSAGQDSTGADDTAAGSSTGADEPTGGDDPTGGDEAFVGRWAGVSQVDDLTFAAGRNVRLDEIFVLEEGGAMRGDFSGWDEQSGCVVVYRLAGSYAVDAATVDVGWDSIRVAVSGCLDDADNQAEADVDADERALWDAELDGTWSADADALTIVAGDGELVYQRIDSPLVARWQGSSAVTDFEFAPGTEVTLAELFWMNDDGSMVGHFSGNDPASQCNVDYRLTGAWSFSEPDLLDAQWDAISLEVWGCTDDAFNAAPADVIAEEGDLWDDELDGAWEVSADQLTITGDAGTIVYTRDL